MSIEFQDQDIPVRPEPETIDTLTTPTSGLLGFLIKIKIVHTKTQATVLVALIMGCFFIASGAIIFWTKAETKLPVVRTNALSDSHAKK